MPESYDTLAFRVGKRLGIIDARLKSKTDVSKHSRNFQLGYEAGYLHPEEWKEEEAVDKHIPSNKLIRARCHVCGGEEGNCKCLI